MPRSRAPPLSCSCSGSWAVYFYYSVLNVLVLTSVYYQPASVLYVQPERDYGQAKPKDSGVECLLWLCVLFSWLALYALQGSSPGYAPEGERLEGVLVGGGSGDQADGDGSLAGQPLPAAAAQARLRPAELQLPSAAWAHGEKEEEEGKGLSGAAAQPRPAAASAAEGGEAGASSTGAGADLEAAAAAAAAAAPPTSRTCAVCYGTQQPRTHHCRICDRCVPTFDHHCTLLATCIGERNRARFLLFVFAQALASACVIGILNSGFVYRAGTGEWMAANGLAIATLVFMWPAQLLALWMVALHTWCMLTNSTSWEITRGAGSLWYLQGRGAKECDIPFSQGLLGNVRLFCCQLEAWDCWPGSSSSRGGRCSPESCCCKDERQWQQHEWVPVMLDRDAQDPLQIWENAWCSMC